MFSVKYHNIHRDHLNLQHSSPSSWVCCQVLDFSKILSRVLSDSWATFVKRVSLLWLLRELARILYSWLCEEASCKHFAGAFQVCTEFHRHILRSVTFYTSSKNCTSEAGCYITCTCLFWCPWFVFIFGFSLFLFIHIISPCWDVISLLGFSLMLFYCLYKVNWP